MAEQIVLGGASMPDSTDEGLHSLSRREMEVIRRAREGMTDKQIANDLGLSVPTLRSCWNVVREKLGAVNRTHAIALATIGQPVPETGDLRSRLVDGMVRDRISMWIWRSRPRHLLLDALGAQIFCLPAPSEPIPITRLLTNVWAPDRARFERFLSQGGDLRPMTPIEFRVGQPGDYRNLIRTVNLAADGGSEPTLLLATTILHVFPS